MATDMYLPAFRNIGNALVLWRRLLPLFRGTLRRHDRKGRENSISLRGVIEIEQQFTRSSLRTFHHEGQ